MVASFQCKFLSDLYYILDSHWTISETLIIQTKIDIDIEPLRSKFYSMDIDFDNDLHWEKF